MKKILLAALLFTAMSVQAQNEKYMNAMKASLTAIDTSFKNPENLLNLANRFERIGNAEKSQWHPYYYAALMQVNYAFVSGKIADGDLYAEKAEALLIKADSLSPQNSEITTVKAMIATLRMIVNPMQRFMKYGMEIETHLKNAMEQDPTNPRPYHLKGQNLKNTPSQFGGGCATAKPFLEEAKNRFATFKPASELAPVWGSERNETILKECQ